MDKRKKEKKDKTLSELREARLKKLAKITELKREIVELGKLINQKVLGGEK